MRPDTIRWLVVFLGLTLGFLAGPGLRVSPSYAESESRGIELLTRATKTYEAGAYGDAAALIEAAFKAGLTGETAARAILLRAQINEKNGALARALQDYSNALWMDVLGAQDRQRAANGKERMMAAMGLGSPSAPAPRPARSVVSDASSSSSSSSIAPDAHADGSAGGVFSYFGGIFGSSESKPEAAPAQPQQSAQASAASGAKPAAAPQKSADKAPAKAAPAKVAQASKPPAAQASLQPASALSVASGPEGFLIVFGTASNEAAGRATAKSIKAQLSDILVNRDIEVAPKGGGSFRVQAGPYKTKSSAMALCSAMSQRGIPCQVTP